MKKMSQRRRTFRYLVEGKCEKILVESLQRMEYIEPGAIEIFNVIEHSLPQRKLYSLKPNTTIVMIFDTDTNQIKILKDNISLLQAYKKRVRQILCIPQVQNLEDELKRSCSLTDLQNLFGSKSTKDFKRDLIKCSNLEQTLRKHSFSIEAFWSSKPVGVFCQFQNESIKIKKRKGKPSS